TPQIARMDARSLPESSERRLCYVGTVIRGSGDALGGSRAPIQLGGELFGADNATSDHEVLDLLAELLIELGVPEGVFDLGHVGIFRSLAEGAGLTSAQIECLRDATARKAVPEIRTALAEWSVAADYAQALVSLCQLSGPVEQVAEQANSRIAPLLDQSGREALQRLTEVARLLQRYHSARHQILVDLAEVHGYHYHTGLVFAVYLPRLGRALARGGRYNNIGNAFGRARPAIGFSLDLRDLAAFAPRQVREQLPVYAPADSSDPELREAVLALRRRGRRVISTMDNIQKKPARLERSGDNQQTWQLVEDKNDG
ncbi:MAG TPA: ATP phosphoribosyltransferase regulatory subunit, partial [Halothiobacillaceae bacterium]|nr:ATP phosphoribosyltransferase regulatory subunit [Halothiobacillaceae bacterium]